MTARLSRIWRVLTAIILLIIALPFIYVFGVYALIFGGYALAAVGGVFFALFNATDGFAIESLGVTAFYFVVAALVLVACVGVLYAILLVLRSIFSIARPANRR